MRSFFGVAVALSALSLVSATTNFTINPNEVALATRATWCQGQTATCTTLCDENPQANTCNPNTLNYTCTCQNGTQPGLQYYSQTVDSFVCQQAYKDCIAQNENNSTGQGLCKTNIMDNCGTLDASTYTGSASTSSAGSSATASSTASSTASGSSSSASSSSSAAAAAPTNLQHLGTAAMAVGMGVLAYLV